MTTRRVFIVGVLSGLVALSGARLLVNETPLADYLVAPLLLPDTTGPAEAIVVLGAAVVGGCTPNQNGVRRVLLAARLWRAGRAPVVLFSGGSGPPDCPVGSAMARLAEEIGVPRSVIRLETTSRNTYENGVRSAGILRALGARRLLLVTDRLHMRRARDVFTSFGFEVASASVPIYEGHPDNVSMLAAASRETTALVYYRLRGWTGAATRVYAMHQSTGARRADAARSEPAMSTIVNPRGPIAVLGASYAAGWDLKQVSGIPIINLGIGGQQSFEMLQRFERDVVPLKPRAVILWGFINDLFRAEAQDFPGTVKRIGETYSHLVRVSRHHGIEPIIATEVTVRPQDSSWSGWLRSWIGDLRGKESYQDRINVQVDAVNRALADLADREDVWLLDFQRVLSEDSSRRRRRTFTREDGSHITPAGYAALTAYARPRLEERYGEHK